ncbi:MAG TPA: PEGA domain-containing protein [Candidatus Marinimicrobia bacterium]|nr:PEGA domain-containing protein [Candidatus Neomarinimicrobiota bacterium]HRS52783.1 PEGA domain-containing protein [Candidatus Neomarinimicrobiota bacterium]HRU93319.1 PEGA domain-containing protein [Candidatus Neomarinimicrobiota bacterium]
MQKTRLLLTIFLLGASLLAQEELQEFEVKIQLVEKGVSAEPNSAKLLVKSTIPDLTFESNRGIKKVEKDAEGEWKLTLYPGNQQLAIKAAGFLSYSERFTFDKQKVYDCLVTPKSKGSLEKIDQNLFEITFELNVDEVYCSFGQYAPLLSSGKKVIFKMPAGEYTFRFEKNQFRPVLLTLKVDQDKTVPIKLEADVTQRVAYRPPGIVAVETNPPGAEVLIDGQKFPSTPATFNLTEGEHEIELRKAFYYPYYGKFTLAAGESKTVRQNLIPRFGYVTINSVPSGVEVFLNGKSVGITPIQNLKQNSGSYLLTAKLDMYYPYEEKFDLKDNELKEFSIVFKPAFGTLEIHSTPEEGAEVLINGKKVGVTPYIDQRCPSGNYQIEVRKKLYYSATETIPVEDGKATQRTFVLKSNYGRIAINSSPEEGAEVWIDGKLVGVTPYLDPKCPSGIYQVEVKKPYFFPTSEQITVVDNKETRRTFILNPSVGTLVVNAPGADIYLNDTRLGTGKIEKKLDPGIYTITAQRDKYYPETKEIYLTFGEVKTVDIDLQPKIGSLSINVEPLEARNANIIFDSKPVGQAPKVITDLIGVHQIEVTAPRFLPESRSITIVENQNIPVKFKLMTYEGSILQKQAYWKRNSYISLGLAALSAGAGIVLNRYAHTNYDKYTTAPTKDDAVTYRKNVELGYTLSLVSFGISIGSVGGGGYCWYRFKNVRRFDL